MFNDLRETAALRKQTQQIRKRSYFQRRSRLDKYTGELLSLHRAGCSIAELQRWLRKRRIKVAHSTVSRWLQKHG